MSGRPNCCCRFFDVIFFTHPSIHIPGESSKRVIIVSRTVGRTVICIFPTYKLQQVFSRASGKNLILQENVTRLNETGRVNYDGEKQKNDWGVILWMLFFLLDDEWTVLAVHSSRNMPINSLRLLLYSHTVMRKILPDMKQLRLLENRTKNAAYMFQHCYDFFYRRLVLN
jgi:hypothetical protein